MEVLTKLRPTFSALREWEGYIVRVTDTHILADLIDLTKGANRANEQAEISIEEFSDSDREKLAPGKVFRWAIGYQRSPSGTKMRGSQFVFRELPQWTIGELKDAKKDAAELFKFLSQGSLEQFKFFSQGTSNL